MRKDYKINQHNSTVCGYPGRDFDWAKFDWNQETTCDFGDMRYSSDSEFVPDELKGQLIGMKKAPEVYVDDGLIAPNCQYLHVPYNWSEHGTVYRVRPNETMYAGKIYRGHLIKKQTAVKKADGWYWRLFFEAPTAREK
jgi:hypothetical protein